MTELKSCPFCGGEYTQVRYIGGEWQEPSAFVSGYRGECCSCYAITAAYDTEAEAAAAWNTRHVDDGALYAACKELVSYAGTCPFDARSLDEWSEYCERECSTDIDMAKCWERYFLECGRKVEG